MSLETACVTTDGCSRFAGILTVMVCACGYRRIDGGGVCGVHSRILLGQHRSATQRQAALLVRSADSACNVRRRVGWDVGRRGGRMQN